MSTTKSSRSSRTTKAARKPAAKAKPDTVQLPPAIASVFKHSEYVEETKEFRDDPYGKVRAFLAFHVQDDNGSAVVPACSMPFIDADHAAILAEWVARKVREMFDVPKPQPQPAGILPDARSPVAAARSTAAQWDEHLRQSRDDLSTRPRPRCTIELYDGENGAGSEMFGYDLPKLDGAAAVKFAAALESFLASYFAAG